MQRLGMSGSAWQALRLSILKRDEYICYVCGNPGADEVDHKIPVWKGGAKSDPGNLGAIHSSPCHEDKTAAEHREQMAMIAAHRRA